MLELLENSGLPTSGVAEQLDTFVVVESEGRVVGVGGIELHDGGIALLRSIAVTEDRRSRGIASAICDRLETDALRHGIDRIYLLTETARPFFESRGYQPLARDQAPATVARCEEFKTLCPETAVLMSRRCGAA
jgi:N-acetylglutamate synthase-like GNAT family acetyltransferase